MLEIMPWENSLINPLMWYLRWQQSRPLLLRISNGIHPSQYWFAVAINIPEVNNRVVHDSKNPINAISEGICLSYVNMIRQMKEELLSINWSFNKVQIMPNNISSPPKAFAIKAAKSQCHAPISDSEFNAKVPGFGTRLPELIGNI